MISSPFPSVWHTLAGGAPNHYDDDDDEVDDDDEDDDNNENDDNNEDDANYDDDPIRGCSHIMSAAGGGGVGTPVFG